MGVHEEKEQALSRFLEINEMKSSARQLALFASIALALIVIIEVGLPGQAQRIQRTKDGKPNLNGVWQAITSASWNIQDHSAAKGVPAGRGIVEGGVIPYKPEALSKRKELYENRHKLDPLHQCYLQGVPRIMYMPFSFEITQVPHLIGLSFEYTHATRLIYTDGSKHPEGLIDFWMGDSRGRWDGDTPVVDVAKFNGETWFDGAGNFHSDA